MGAFKYFIGIIVLQLFYSFSITLFSHALIDVNPNYAPYLGDYQNLSTDLSDMTSQIEGSLQNQMNIPVIDLGALVFYSGNIIIDLMMNFFFALPSLVTLFVNTLINLFPIDAFLGTYIKLFVYSIISILYFIQLLAFIINIRSRGSIV